MDRRVEFLIKQGKKRSQSNSIVDLQMSHHPLADLNMLLEKTPQLIEECTQLDLSRAYFNSDTLDIFCDQIQSKFGALTKVLVAGDEPWLNDFSEKCNPRKFRILIRSEIKFADLSINMFSRTNLRRLENIISTLHPSVFQAMEFKPS